MRDLVLRRDGVVTKTMAQQLGSSSLSETLTLIKLNAVTFVVERYCPLRVKSGILLVFFVSRLCC